MKEKIEWVVDVIKKSAMYLLLLIANLLILTSLLYFFNITITPYHLPVIAIVSAIIFCLFYRKQKISTNIIAIVVAIIIFAVGVFVEGKIYDTTADGNTYHKLAIGCMKNGWNPANEDSRDFMNRGENDFTALEDNINPLWIDHYPKATEIFAANVYAFTNNIESGKVYTLLLMYVAFGIFTSYLYRDKKMNLAVSLIIPLLLVVNPITIVQIPNYYVDGALGISLFLLIFTCVTIPFKKEEHLSQIEKLFILAVSIILCINIKFTGLGFAGIFCFVFYFYWLYRAKKENTFAKDFKVYTIFYVITVLVSLLIVGYTSYTRNFIDHGHPCYPLYGKDAVENIGLKEQPKSFMEKNRLEIFLTSIFSKGENVLPSYPANENQPELKVPFTFTKDELKNYNIPDIRIGGFGPLFSGIFILSIITTIVMFVDWIRKKKWDFVWSYALILGVSFILLIAIDGIYWARYVPYVYIIPIASLLYLFQDDKNKVKMICGIALTALIGINSAMLLYVTGRSTLDNNRYVNTKLNEFANACVATQTPVKVKLSHAGVQGVQYNLKDKKITNYVLDDTIEVTKDGYFFGY